MIENYFPQLHQLDQTILCHRTILCAHFNSTSKIVIVISSLFGEFVEFEMNQKIILDGLCVHLMGAFRWLDNLVQRCSGHFDEECLVDSNFRDRNLIYLVHLVKKYKIKDKHTATWQKEIALKRFILTLTNSMHMYSCLGPVV